MKGTQNQHLTFNMFYTKWVNRLELSEEWKNALINFDFNQKGGPKNFEKLIKSLPVVLPLDYNFGIFRAYVQFNTELYSVIVATDPHGCISGDVHLQKEGVVIDKYVCDIAKRQYIIAGKTIIFTRKMLQEYEWTIEYIPLGAQVSAHPDLVIDIYKDHKLLYANVEKISMTGNQLVWDTKKVKFNCSMICFISGEKQGEFEWSRMGDRIICFGEVQHAALIITRGKRKQGFFERMFGNKKKDDQEEIG